MQYKTMLLIAAIIFFIWASITYLKTNSIMDEKCKYFYGPEYFYIDGDRSPDLCVTEKGDIKYFNLIK